MTPEELAYVIERQREIAFSLCAHPVDSFEKYQRQVGVFQGLQETLALHEHLQQEEDKT